MGPPPCWEKFTNNPAFFLVLSLLASFLLSLWCASRRPSWTLPGTSSGCSTGRAGRGLSFWQTEPAKALSLPYVKTSQYYFKALTLPAPSGQGTRFLPALRLMEGTCSQTTTATREPSFHHQRLGFLATERIIFHQVSPPSNIFIYFDIFWFFFLGTERMTFLPGAPSFKWSLMDEVWIPEDLEPGAYTLSFRSSLH